ncbi:hypothetical protein LPJ66_002429 [Kickxella alabastrina]|uniref:Uncharacterized protein n=1 Tax=Kickxella alabastrina TaxID=61397 RepID=A0ACC1IQF7_9FUNG|nr:hypothetical protein LPJ66_002429 [Kickxella alabastrina]
MTSSGNKIKVVCRVRPFLKTEKTDESVGVEANNVLRVTNPRDTTKDVKFNFDSCYGPVVGQDVIYNNDVRPLVETIFTGLSATVFCYGVTGAGKTHTIQGSETEPGIIPRAMEHIFKHQERDSFDYDIRVSYYEIYKEAVFDLLKQRDSVAGLPIREDANRKIFVAGLSEKKVTSYEQFDTLYQKACGNRRTASTKLNNHSSRSHAILTVQVQWKDDIGSGKTWCGRLHLIDLAGSEDNRRTENGKDRMAESSAINRSLFVLGQVVEALNIGASRIPYRDSKMTRILQDSLGGDSLGMMIVNVSPGEAFLQDTHNTLNFATKSREVVNKPVAHEVVEQRWSVSDRMQHHRGMGRPMRSAVVSCASGTLAASSAIGSGGVKRGRSDGLDESEGEDLPLNDNGAQLAAGARRRISPAGGLQSNHPDAASRRPAPQQADFVQKVVTARFSEMEQKSESASSKIMERVEQLEKRLNGKQLDSNAVLDLFTPSTKLKTSRGWLKHARELEQAGHLERALTHYEEALRYAPGLNKLEAHITKLCAKIRREKRRSSINSHGEANVIVSERTGSAPIMENGMLVGDGDDFEKVSPMWLNNGQDESPSAGKGKGRQRTLASTLLSMVADAKNGDKTGQKPQQLPAHKPLFFPKVMAETAAATANATSANDAATAAAAAAATAAGKPNMRRVRLLGDAGKKSGVIQNRFVNITEGSVHDRQRLSFGTSSLNPFVVGGEEFQSDLRTRLETKKVPVATLRATKLDAKSSAAARLRRALPDPATPEDRRDKDFVLHSGDEDDAEDMLLVDEDSRNSLKKANPKARRGGRVPGSLSVRGLVERRIAEKGEQSDEGRSESRGERLSDMSASSKTKTSPSTAVGAAEKKLSLGQFNDICLASAVQMINSGEVKKIMKLQGIGKRRAEQIQDSVQSAGPISHILELQARLQFKNKIILGILSTFA